MKQKKEELTDEGKGFLEDEYGSNIEDVRLSGFAPSWATKQDAIHALNKIGAMSECDMMSLFFEGMRWQKKKQIEIKFEMGNWKLDDDSPNRCMSCDDDFNGVFYAKIKIGKIILWINVCEKCKDKLDKQR